MADLSKCNVLIVDDTEENLDLLVELLSDDYDVSVATDGEGALQSVEANLPDLILLDIMMPSMDGYEVCRRLKAEERFASIPVIFVTAMGDVEDEAKGLSLGAIDYLTKPISPAIVSARVKNHLELKLARQDLEQQNQILKENARLREDSERMARHDLKTPLNAVISIPGMLINEGNLSQEQVDMLRMLEESGYRMLDIVNSSLDLHKMETKVYQPRPVPVDLIPIVHKISGETKTLIQVKHIELKCMVRGDEFKSGDTFVAQGEEMLFYSMLANLIKNAVEASPENETVTIAFEDQEKPVITIHNKGMVAEEIRETFFDKYVTWGKEGGTGLGTYSAKLIAETLGGEITFTSTAKAGTTLMINLSSATGAQAPAIKAAKSSKSEIDKGIRILIADDYATMRRTMMGVLRQMGFTNVTSAEDGSLAEKILHSETINLIISDLHMPKINGLQLLKRVREDEALKHIPFIMVTGESSHDVVAKAAQFKVSDYIVKPFPADLLKRKIERIFS